jgi:hypothetical protein
MDNSVSELMAQGFLCQVCAEPMDDAPGHPRTCEECQQYETAIAKALTREE